MAIIIAAGSAVLIVCGFFLFVFVGFILNPIIPADVQIARAIDENKDLLESIDGVLAAGFGSNVHIDGINIYIDAAMTNIEAVPTQLGDFQVFLIRIDNSQPQSREGFLWWSQDLNLNPGKRWPSNCYFLSSVAMAFASRTQAAASSRHKRSASESESAFSSYSM